MCVSPVCVSTAFTAAQMSRLIWSGVLFAHSVELPPPPAPSAVTLAVGTEALLIRPVQPFSDVAAPGVLPVIAIERLNTAAALRAAEALSLDSERPSLAARCSSCVDHS